MKTKPGRRTFLRALGLAGGAPLLGPLCRRLIGEAHGQAAATKRFILFTAGSGLLEEHYRPPRGGTTDYEMPETFRPLEAVRERLLLIEKLGSPHSQVFHGSGWSTLSCRTGPKGDAEAFSDGIGAYHQPGGISLDRFIAKQIGGGHPHDSINLMIVGKETRTPLHVSADGAGMPYPAHYQPVQAFASIFGGQPSNTPGQDTAAVKNMLAAEKSLLDFMGDDIARLNRALAGPERQKLDQYLESLRALEKRLVPLADGSAATDPACTGLTAPTPMDKPGWGTSPMNRAVLEAQVDILTNAIICGRTAVAAYSLHGNGTTHRPWLFLGEPPDQGDKGLHGMQHKSQHALIHKVNHFYFSEMVRAWKRLESIPEGNGSMADNTIMMHVNTGGEKHHLGGKQHALLILGNAGSRMKTGRYLRYPEGRHNLGDAYLAILHALGIEVASFGDPAKLKGPLPELA